MPAVIGEYLSAAEYYLAYDIAVEFHYEVQLRDEVRMIPQMVKYIMLGAAWLIDIPKGFSTEIFNCSVICFRLSVEEEARGKYPPDETHPGDTTN